MDTIQWFPGHMAQAKKSIAKALKSVDLVVEVLDARMPPASANPLVEELRLTRQRPVLKVLNKSDLADPAITKNWLQSFRAQDNLFAVEVCSKHKSDVRNLIREARKQVPHRSDAIKPLRMMVMGVPNVGKSTLLNAILGRSVAKAADEPAVTRSVTRYDLDEKTIIYDSPGLMWSKLESQENGYALAVNNAIGVNAYVPEEVAVFLAEKLRLFYANRISDRYGFDSSNLDANDILQKIGSIRGARIKGDEVDLERSANILLTDYRKGKLGRITIQVPD
ncbi:MAG: ribosome biogenesis GTPase YlqF [Betaproteobacteria bacterium]